MCSPMSCLDVYSIPALDGYADGLQAMDGLKESTTVLCSCIVETRDAAQLEEHEKKTEPVTVSYARDMMIGQPHIHIVMCVPSFFATLLLTPHPVYLHV